MKVLIQLGEDPKDEANLHEIINEIDLSGDNEIDAEEVRTFVLSAILTHSLDGIDVRLIIISSSL